MGTVHGVYLKYVGLSAISFAGMTLLTREGESVAEMFKESASSLFSVPFSRALSTRAFPVLALGYSTILNGLIAVLFKSEWGMGLIGKDPETGQIPYWSYFFFFPFHIPTRLYTYIHSVQDANKTKVVPVASEVQPGWYVGGCYGHKLDMEWAAVIDLTVEFPETTATKAYLSLPTWDGVPATPAQLEEAATFAVHHYTASSTANINANASATIADNVGTAGKGPILVHCAHGRGRSTTVMCACLVKAGLFATWEEAFQKGIQPGRSVCKLNRRMKQNLAEWQAIYVDGKKGQ